MSLFPGRGVSQRHAPGVGLSVEGPLEKGCLQVPAVFGKGRAAHQGTTVARDRATHSSPEGDLHSREAGAGAGAGGQGGWCGHGVGWFKCFQGLGGWGGGQGCPWSSGQPGEPDMAAGGERALRWLVPVVGKACLWFFISRNWFMLGGRPPHQASEDLRAGRRAAEEGRRADTGRCRELPSGSEPALRLWPLPPPPTSHALPGVRTAPPTRLPMPPAAPAGARWLCCLRGGSRPRVSVPRSLSFPPVRSTGCHACCMFFPCPTHRKDSACLGFCFIGVAVKTDLKNWAFL